MAIIENEDTPLTYRYRVKEFYLLFDKEEKKLTNASLISLMIVNDFIGSFFPIIQLKMNASSTLYYKILKQKNSVRFKIRIQKYTVKNGQNESEKSLYTDYIDEVFQLILDDDDEDLYSDVRKLNNGDGQTDEDLKEQSNVVEFFLFKSSLIKASKKLTNKMLVDSNVTDAIVYIMNKIGITNLLMSKADNGTIYHELQIPPLNANRALSYLDSFYGIHKTGSILFFGLRNSYVIRYEGKCSVYRKKEVKLTTVLIPKAGTALSQNCCSLNKKGDKNSSYIIADFDNVKFSNESTSNNLLTGDDVQVIDSETGDIDDSSKVNGTNKKIIENKGLSKYYKSAYLKNTNSLDSVITVNFSDFDLDTILPHKKFNMIFEDKKLSLKYKGSYILGKTEIALLKEGDYLSANAICTFYSDK